MLKYLSILITGYDLAKYRPGIGPNSWGYWRILIPFQGRFFNAGETHDFWYSFGGNEDDKQEADFQFYEDCMNISGKNLFAIYFASIYFILVSKFGSYYFNYW